MNFENQCIFRDKVYIYWHDIDGEGRLTFAALARYLQETAWHSAENMGFGYKKAMELGQYWVLVRQLIKFYRFPQWAEEVFIETWPRGVDGLWAFRDYYLKDWNEEIIGGITSSWMIVDSQTHRPQKPEIVKDVLQCTITEQALGRSAPKIVCHDPMETVDIRTVRYSDIDKHGHANNSKFIEWAFDALNKNGLANHSSELAINYLSEVKNGDLIRIDVGDDKEKLHIRGIRQSDKRAVFTASVLTQAR